MADKITMDTELLVQLSSKVSQLQNSLSDIAGSISSSISEVRRVAASQTPVINKLTDTKKKTLIAADNANHLSKAIRRSANLWEEAEKALAGTSVISTEAPFGVINSDTIGSILSGMSFDALDETNNTSENHNANNYNPIFNEDPDYKSFGGDQGSPKNDYMNYDTFRSIIEKNTGRRLTDKELKIYLRKLNTEGCGYVALINTIFAAYEGRPEDFKNAFGFDMYDSFGRPNFNELLVDIYSATDNRNADGTIDKYEDYDDKDGPEWLKWFYNPWKDEKGKGTTIDQREERMQMFLNDHGVQCDVNSYDHQILTATEYNNLVTSGEVKKGELHIRVSGEPVILRDSNGYAIDDACYSGSHAMTVTGTTESGLLQVSSWGEVYYIDPANLGNNTDMGYQIIHIKS